MKTIALFAFVAVFTVQSAFAQPSFIARLLSFLIYFVVEISVYCKMNIIGRSSVHARYIIYNTLYIPL